MFETQMLGGREIFPDTSWSLISVCRDSGTAKRREGLEQLVMRYWAPVYRYVYRNWGRDVDRSRDLTQAFFLAFLEKDFIDSVDADRGRFRSFVLVALRNFLSKRVRAEKALKRRPAAGLASLDAIRCEIPASPTFQDPEEQFDQDWRRAVLILAMERLRVAAGDAKKHYVDLFVAHDLEPPPTGRPSYTELAEQMGYTVSQVTNGLHWARQEFRRIVLEELAEQVVSPSDLKKEARELFGLES